MVFLDVYLVSWVVHQRGRMPEALLRYTANASLAVQLPTCPYSFLLAIPSSVPGHPAGGVKWSPRFIPDDICVVCLRMLKINV